MGLISSALRKKEEEVDLESKDEYDLVEEETVRVTSVVDLNAIHIEEQSKDIASYCLPLVDTAFFGETSTDGNTDEAGVTNVLNLGLYLSLLDKFLRTFENVTDFTAMEDEFLQLLKLVAMKRHRDVEAIDDCYERLKEDGRRFVKIYHKRGVKSEALFHDAFWGSRQQLLAGKVIADWIDQENGPLDPLFGVLLQPTAGRVGPGDSGWIHSMLFDDEGHMAFHSAVHDAFGYLITFHETGPGYDYMQDSYLAKDNPMAGQLSGIDFWRSVLAEVKTKTDVINRIKI